MEKEPSRQNERLRRCCQNLSSLPTFFVKKSSLKFGHISTQMKRLYETNSVGIMKKCLDVNGVLNMELLYCNMPKHPQLSTLHN